MRWEKIINSKIRIGACEVCAVLRSQNIPSKLIDFKSNKPNTNENLITNYFSSSSSSYHVSCEEEVCEVVWDYFSTQPNSFPIYFQEPHHAVTIVGCYKEDEKVGKIRLLVFDSIDQMNNDASFTSWKEKFTYKFKKSQKEFQMILVYNNNNGYDKKLHGDLLAKTYSGKDVLLYKGGNYSTTSVVEEEAQVKQEEDLIVIDHD